MLCIFQTLICCGLSEKTDMVRISEDFNKICQNVVNIASFGLHVRVDNFTCRLVFQESTRLTLRKLAHAINRDFLSFKS